MRLHLSLRSKLYMGFLFFAMAGLFVGGFLVDRSVRSAAQNDLQDRLTYETTMLGQMTANALFGEIDPSDSSLNTGLRTLAESVHTEFAMITKDGVVVADSESDDPLSLPSQLGAPEIVAARATGTGSAIRDGRIFVARAIQRDNRFLGYVRSSVPMGVIARQVRGVRLRLVYGALVALAVAVILGYALSSRILSPMRAVFAAARRVGAGDLEHAIAVTTKDEVAELSTAFNGIIVNLRETIAKLDSRNRDMRLVLDNVNQGLLTLDRGGVVSLERSAILDQWLGPVAPGTTFWAYLAHSDAACAGMFHCAWDELLEGAMPFEVAFAQLPLRMRADTSEYELKYTPLLDSGGDGAMTGMLITVSDVTARLAAERSEGEQRQIATAFERVMKDRSAFSDFVAEAQVLVDQLCGETQPSPVVVRRLLHTLKGNSALFGLTRFASLCHEVEQRFSAGDARVAEADLLHLAGAWNDLRTRLQAVLGERAEGRLDIDDRDREELLTAVANGLPRRDIVRQLADWRLERAETKLNRFAAQARELGARLGKGEIDVVVRADGLRLSRDALAPFWASFVHVIRNAVDHGIDYPEERARSGKRERPLLTLTASRAGDVVVIAVIDDGHGVDWEAVGLTARRLGLPHENQEDLINALFHDGFSTKASVSEVSGRGIGLGVARAECERLGGIVTVASEGGQGTAFRFHFPSQKVANSPSSPPERAEPGSTDKASPPPQRSSSFSSAAEAESFVPRTQVPRTQKGS